MANVQINDLPLNLNPPATSELELQLTGGGDSQKATLADLWANGAPSANDGELMRYESSSGAWESSNGIVIADGVTSTQLTVNPSFVQTSQLVVGTSETFSITVNGSNLAGAFLRLADGNTPGTYNYIGIKNTSLTMGRWGGAEFARFSNAGNFIVGRDTVNDSYRIEAYTATGPSRLRVLANAGAAELYLQAVDTDNARLFFGDQITQASAGIEWINATNRLLFKAQGNNSTVLEFNAAGSALFAEDVVAGNRVLAEEGTGTNPAYSFTIDDDTGMWRGGPDQIDLGTGGSSRLRISTSSINPFHPVLAQVGSESNPAYSFAVDTGTGLYRAAASAVGIAAGGVTRVLVDGNQTTVTEQLGVNTSPTVNVITCRARGPSDGIAILRRVADEATSLLFRDETDAITNAQIELMGTSAAPELRFNVQGAEALRIDSSQQVGIGTNSPTRLLHVQGTGTTYARIAASNAAAASIVEIRGGAGGDSYVYFNEDGGPSFDGAIRYNHPLEQFLFYSNAGTLIATLDASTGFRCSQDVQAFQSL